MYSLQMKLVEKDSSWFFSRKKTVKATPDNIREIAEIIARMIGDDVSFEPALWD